LLERFPEKIVWHKLSENPAARHILEANLDNVHWFNASENPSLIHLLDENHGRIEWYVVSKNPEIFEYDYKGMTRPFTEELMANRFHPNNFGKFEAWGF
jgi:hypothetical protein